MGNPPFSHFLTSNAHQIKVKPSTHTFSPESLKTSWSNPVQHFAFPKTFKTCWSNPGQQVLFRQIKKSRYSSFLRRRPGRGALAHTSQGLSGPSPLIPVQWQLSVLTLTTQGPSSSSPCPHFHRPIKRARTALARLHRLLLLAQCPLAHYLAYQLET